MPHIPTFERSVTTQPLRLARGSTAVPQGAFGQGSAAALQQIGRLIGQRAIEQQTQDNAAGVLDALGEAKLQANALMHGTETEPGLYSLTGRSAKGVFQKAAVGFQEIGKTVREPLNSAQRRAFDEQWARTTTWREENASKFEAAQRRTANVASDKANVTNEIQDAVANYGSDKAHQEALDAIRLSAIQNISGDPVEVVEAVTRARVSSLHAGKIERALEEQPILAKAYFDEHEDQMLPEHRARMAAKLKPATEKALSQQAADTLWNTPFEGETQAAQDSAMLDAARGIEDPQIRDATVARIKERIDTRNRLQAAAQVETTESAWRAVEADPRLDTVPTDPDIKHRDRAAMQKFATSPPPVTNWQAHYELSQLVSPDDAESFARLNLYRDFRNLLADVEFKQMVDLQEQARNRTGPFKQGAARILDLNTQVNLALSGVDIHPQNSKEEAKKAGQFWGALQHDMLSRGLTKDSPMSEIQPLIDALVLPGNPWLGFERRLFEVGTPEEFATRGGVDIPQDVRIEIEQDIESDRREITEEEVIIRYIRRVRGESDGG